VAFHASQTSPIAQTLVAFTGKAMSVVFKGAETPQTYLKKHWLLLLDITN
jgi:hypothetical protein